MAKRSKRRKAPRTQTRSPRAKREPLSEAYQDVTQRPLQCLVFLLPFILAYEIGMALTYSGQPLEERRGLAAEQLLRWFFSLFGASGAYLPGAAVVVVLLVWHLASHNPWKISVRPLFVMAGESVILAIPLMFLCSRLANLQATTTTADSMTSTVDNMLLSIGAGIYEELVFRLILIALLTFLLIDVCRMRQAAGVALSVIVSSMLFGLHHYYPVGADDWQTSEFAFRTAAGAYLAAVFVLRGFGLAVGCHIVYDIVAFLKLV